MPNVGRKQRKQTGKVKESKNKMKRSAKTENYKMTNENRGRVK